MSKTLAIIIAVIAASFAVPFFGFVNPFPVAVVWGAGVSALSILAGVYWTQYTITNHPEKFARLYAKYLPIEEAKALIANGKSIALDKLRDAILLEVRKLFH